MATAAIPIEKLNHRNACRRKTVGYRVKAEVFYCQEINRNCDDFCRKHQAPIERSWNDRGWAELERNAP